MGRIRNLVIEEYNPFESYDKFSVVEDGNSLGNYYVSRVDGNEANSVNLTGFWSHFNNTGEWAINELWTPSYDVVSDTRLASKTLLLGDGYQQDYELGLSSQRPDFKVQFQNLDTPETKSLLAFFEYKESSEPFVFTDPYFYEERLMVCASWKHIFNQFKLHTVNAIFEEFDDING